VWDSPVGNRNNIDKLNLRLGATRKELEGWTRNIDID
jgi:hypothetical protein